MSEALKTEPPIAAKSVSMLGELTRSWRAMVVIVMGMCVGVLPAYSVGAFVGPISSEMGWADTQVIAWTLAHAAGGIIGAPFIGLLADRFGAHRMVMLCLTAFALILFAMSLMPRSLPLFYLSGGAVGMVGVGISAITFGRIITTLFDKGMATAFGLMSCGIGLSASFGPRVMQAMIDAEGWRMAYITAGLAPLVVLPFAWRWLSQQRLQSATRLNKTATNEAGHSLKSAMRLAIFWVLGVGTVLYGLCAGGMAVNLIPFLTSEGVSRAEAATLLGLLGVFTMIGRFGTGILIDRFQLNAGVFMVCAVVIQASAFALLGWKSTEFMLIAIPIFGLTMGAEADCVAYITAKLFGRRSFAAIFGVVGYAMLFIGTGLGPVLFSLAHHMSGSYLTAMNLFALVAAAGIPLFLMIGRALHTKRTLALAPA